MTIELTPEETEVLRNLLEQELDELNPEIHHTWMRGYREDLKDYRTTVRRLHDRLAAPAESGTAQSAA